MKNHYVYLTTNLFNGKQYVGDHTINPKEKKYYIGSGKPLLYDDIQKFGESLFFKEILEWFETRKEAYNAQEIYIKKFNTLSPNGYNISERGGYGVASSPLRDETKEKIRSKLKNKPKPEGFKKKMKGKKPWNTGITWTEEQKKGLKNRIPWNKGKTNIYSEETLNQISLSKTGRSNPHNDEWNNKISLGKMGFKHSEKTKEKMKKSFEKNLQLKKQLFS